MDPAEITEDQCAEGDQQDQGPVAKAELGQVEMRRALNQDGFTSDGNTAGMSGR